MIAYDQREQDPEADDIPSGRLRVNPGVSQLYRGLLVRCPLVLHTVQSSLASLAPRDPRAHAPFHLCACVHPPPPLALADASLVLQLVLHVLAVPAILTHWILHFLYVPTTHHPLVLIKTDGSAAAIRLATRQPHVQLQ